MNPPTSGSRLPAAILGIMLGSVLALGWDANRLTYLDEDDPFYVALDFPVLATPQWVGEDGVEAVVTLGIDDMREHLKYEQFLRPILERLKQIDGRAPVSIFCNAIDPQEPHLQKWLAEGLNIEVHTLSHPCPILGKSNFVAAVDTFMGGVDLMHRIPSNHPVAFRTPCCDSINSPSPRLYSEIFNRTTPGGEFLQADSSVMNVFTSRDASLPVTALRTAEGKERFPQHLPFPSFVTTIENYPYPYALGRVCWEFPGVVPSDWEAQHIRGKTNALTVQDWNLALDLTVQKQGAFNLIFHPHGWCTSEQIVEIIDHAVSTHGAKVKFLNFHEAVSRLTANLLGGEPLRAKDGSDNGVRLLDLNQDGYLDVVVANARTRQTRVWQPQSRNWRIINFPVSLARPGDGIGARFGILHTDGFPTVLLATDSTRGAWHYDGTNWVAHPELLRGLEIDGQPLVTAKDGRDRGVRFRDVNGDGVCELIVGNESQNAIFEWHAGEQSWKRVKPGLPEGTAVVTADGEDAGLRFVDINDDGFTDVLFSDADHYSLHLYVSKPVLGWVVGWTREAMSEPRTADSAVPPIVRAGVNRNNGAWVHGRQVWWQNENTAHLADLVDRRSFDKLMAGYVPAPKSPEESLAAFVPRPGFKVELVAAEPLVKDPVAFDWDAQGRLWVVAMVDYPLGTDGHGRPGGTVRTLEDTDGDGRYDRSTLFLEHVNFPNGLIPWRKGVIVSAPPEIFYAEDTDGDGRADFKQLLFFGFREGNQQHRANGFDYGLDNWLYGANGDSGGKVRSDRTGREVAIDGRDFRFRPDTGEFEAIEGQTQFGRHRDDFGNWFGNNNGTWAWHYHVPDRYVARNPRLPLERNRRLLANYEDPTRLYGVSRTMQRFNVVGAISHCSSANSVTPYRDSLFGPGYAGALFVSDPVYNLIHREQLEPDGITFRSHRAGDEQDREFLASRDAWFRPTQLKTGPDGALYVADMYRLVIEHPEWIPPDLARKLDLRAGADLGRIYRIYPEGAVLRRIPNLARMKAKELVASLDSPNGWQRDTAQRLLVERRDRAATRPLIKLVDSNPSPKTRLQALCTLDGLEAVTPKVLLRALGDRDPAVREHAIRISEPVLRAVGSRVTSAGDRPLGANPPGWPAKEIAALTQRLAALTDDASPRVRYQLAFTLGEWNDPRAGSWLGRLALAETKNAELQTAIATSVSRQPAAVLAALGSPSSGSPDPVRLVREQADGTLHPEKLRRPIAKPAAKPAVAPVASRPVEPFATRAELVEKWLPRVAAKVGDAGHGAELFRQQCAACHRLAEIGTGAGPDLASLSDYSAERLVTSILDPNRAVEDRYKAATAITTGDEELTGLLVSQGPNSVTMQLLNGTRETILRSDLKTLTRTDRSMMPEGLEAQLGEQDVADIITFLNASRQVKPK